MANTTTNTNTQTKIGRKRRGRPPGTQIQATQGRRTKYGGQSGQTITMSVTALQRLLNQA